MKLRNLFYLLLAIPMFVVGCDKNNDEPNKPTNAILTLTSESIMEFTAEGGEGVITYTLENAVEGVAVKAECNAKWIKDITVGEEISFTVNANIASDRETKIVVSYQTSSFEVVVKQAKEEKNSEYLYELDFANAQRVASETFDLPEDYVVIAFSNIDSITYAGLVFDCSKSEGTLSSGTYSSAEGNIIAKECEIAINEGEVYAFEGGNITAVVEVNANNYNIDVVLEDVNGNRFHLTFNGVVSNMIPESVNFEAKYCEGYGYGACSKGSWEYAVVLSDLGLGENNMPKAKATYYKLDLFSVASEVDAEGKLTIPVGTYTFDEADTLAEWTIGNEESLYIVMNDAGNRATVQSQFIKATLVVTETNATLTAYIGGIEHIVTYNGVLKVIASLE